MDSEALVTSNENEGIFTNPIPPLIAGVALTFLALLVSLMASGVWIAIPLAGGVLAAGIAVWIRPRSSWILGGAAFVALIGVVTVEKAGWDFTTSVFFWWTALLAGVAALLMLAPTVVRRIAVSLMILWHFTGIMVAVTSAPPASWLSTQLWVYVYRPYLQFLYMNNAYHFYSPEPGPAHLLWFYVEYEPNADGTRPYRWVQVPQLKDGKPVDYDAYGQPHSYPYVEYTRRLSLAETAAQTSGPTNPVRFNKYSYNRGVAGNLGDRRGVKIPFNDPNLAPAMQYREPNYGSKHWISSYARHVARTYKYNPFDLEYRQDKWYVVDSNRSGGQATDRGGPYDTKEEADEARLKIWKEMRQQPDYREKQATSVKVYLITHDMIRYTEFGSYTNPADLKKVEGRGIDDPTLYSAVYMGEFDRDGKMTPSCNEFGINFIPDPSKGEDFKVDHQRDPYLYWLIPIKFHGINETGNASEILHRRVNVDNYIIKHAMGLNDDPKNDWLWKNLTWEEALDLSGTRKAPAAK